MYEAFLSLHSKPAEPTEPGIFFARREGATLAWRPFLQEVGAGRWNNRYLRIGTAELADMHDALQGWGSILPWDEKRQVAVCNGWGDLVLAAHNDKGQSMCQVLSGRRLSVSKPDISMNAHLGDVLMDYLVSTKRIPGAPKEHPFLDDALYQELLTDQNGGEPLAPTDGFLPLVPYPMGGKHEAANFVIQNIADWYRDMGKALSAKA